MSDSNLTTPSSNCNPSSSYADCYSQEARKRLRAAERRAEDKELADCPFLDPNREFSVLSCPDSFTTHSVDFARAIQWCNENAWAAYKIPKNQSMFRVAVEAMHNNRIWLFPGRTLVSAVNKHIRNLVWLTPETRERLTEGKRSTYYDYLDSPEWAAKRDEALRLADFRCQVCYSSTRLDVHHRTYDRFGNELQSDLVVLCRVCHDIFHKHGRLGR